MGPNNNNETSQNEASEVVEPRNLTRFLSQRFWLVFIYCVARAIHLLAFSGMETMPVHRLTGDDKASWERRWERR